MSVRPSVVAAHYGRYVVEIVDSVDGETDIIRYVIILCDAVVQSAARCFQYKFAPVNYYGAGFAGAVSF